MEENSDRLFTYSKYLCFAVLGIVLFGLIMVYSSSYIYAKEVYGTSSYYFTRQLSFVLAAICIIFIISKTKITFWIKYGLYINLAATCLLLLTFVPGFSSGAKGATRWIYFLGGRFQPGELIKFTVLLSSVSLFENWDIESVQKRLWHVLSIVLPMGIVLKQPDFGTFTICGLVIIFSCFMSRFPRKYFYLASFSGLVITGSLLFSQAYRVNRIMAFLDPWKNPKTSGFQIIQSYLAFANGAVFGQGLGNSTEKLFYLPEAHNDFIFSIVGAELGFVGVVLTVVLFLSLIYFGFKLALELEERIHQVLVSTIIFSIGIQTFLNMGVVLGILPTKGLNLPFISSGGSSMMANAFGIGLIMSTVRYSFKKLSFFSSTSPEDESEAYLNSPPPRIPL